MIYKSLLTATYINPLVKTYKQKKRAIFFKMKMALFSYTLKIIS